jgi:DNA-binding NtrC family response regulator
MTGLLKHLNGLEVRMNVPWQIVIASADLEERRAMVNILAKQGLDPIVAASVAECRESTAQENVGLIFCARSLADGDYRDLLLAARAGMRRTRIVLTTRITDWDEYLEAMRLGAFDVISAPCRPTDME